MYYKIIPLIYSRNFIVANKKDLEIKRVLEMRMILMEYFPQNIVID